MQKIFQHTLVIFVLTFFPLATYGDELSFVAEDLPPFHFLDANKKPTGALVEIINELLLRTKLSGHIEIMPFARSYDLALHTKNIFMFSLMKSPDRLDSFQWVGQIFKSKAFLVGLRSRKDINITNLDDAKSFVVGTIRGYHSEAYLKDEGFTLSKNLHLSVNYKHMWNMLFGQHIDFVLTNYIAIDKEMTSIGLDKKDIKTVIELHDFPGELFIATGFNTSRKTITLLSDALQQIKDDGTYQKIISKWSL